MKVCFVTDSYPPNIGGAEIVIKNLVEGAAAQGISATVITPFPNEASLTENMGKDINIVRFTVPKYMMRFWFLLYSIPLIIKHSKDADIIHGTTYGGALPAFIAGKYLMKPVVLTVHEFMGKNWFRLTGNYVSAAFYYFAELILARLSFARYAAVSEYTKERLLEFKIPPGKISLIYNGGSLPVHDIPRSSKEIRKELNINENDFVYTAYGRAGISKGFEYLVDAIPAVLNEVQNSIFLLILTKGDLKIWKRITSKIDRLDKNRVKFLGTQERQKLFDYVNASDAIIIPSLSEGFGYTTLEASKLNKCVIATNVGAIPEVISGNYILIEPGSTEALKNGCIDAFNKEFKNKPGREFNWEKSVKSYVDLYKEIINLSV